MMVRSGL